MSGGLAPSKSTVYVANLSYSLTNNDIHQIFKKYGKVVKVTIVKDKETHRSKGVAFVLFLDREGAYKCVRALDNTQLFGRTIKCSIAKDNGRAVEFIRRKEYKDKTRCYECGEFGHLSYCCPHNLLGDREPPEKKEKKRKRKYRQMEEEEEVVEEEEECESDEGEDPELDSLSTAIRIQQEKVEVEEYRYKVATGQYDDLSVVKKEKKKYKKSAYFSDDDEEIEDT